MAAPTTTQISNHTASAMPIRRWRSARRHRPTGDPTRRRGSPAEVVEPRDEPVLARDAIEAPRFDEKSQAWLDALHSRGARREEAIGRLHALLIREARFEVGRRTAFLTHPSGRDLDDLAEQAANDAVVAILAKLDQFRGDSLFTTWARRFVQREAPAKLRRRLGHARELPADDGFEDARMWPVHADSPHELSVAKESAEKLARLIADELTTRQREVLIALTIDGEPTAELAKRLDTSTGALYKNLYDARRKLEAGLAET